MEIKIQIKGRVFSICIGYKTKWFSQTMLLCISEEYYADKKMEVEFARIIYHT